MISPSSWGQTARARVAAGGGSARVGHRYDEVRVRRRRLARQDLAHPPARGLHDVAAHARVRPREVDVLEDAEGLALAVDDLARVQPVGVDPDELAGAHVAHVLRGDDVQRARFAGDAVVVAVQAPEHERPQPGRVAEGDDLVLGHEDRRERALQARHDVGERVGDVLGLMRGQQRGDDLRVRRRAEADPPLAQLAVQLDGVDEVAVVAERHLAPVRAVDGLGVVPAVGARRRVAHVADGHVARQRTQLLLVEDLVDEPQLAQSHDVAADVRGGDAGGLLSAVLEGVQREVGQPGDVVSGGMDPEHAALVSRSIAVVERGHGSRIAAGAGAAVTEPTQVPGVRSGSWSHR